MTQSDDLARRLVVALGGEIRIDGLKRLPGGASRETWAFTAEGRELILRLDPPGRPGPPGSMALEANAMRASAWAGLQVPEVIAVDDGRVLGTAGLVMARVAGETIARRILRDDEFAQARQVLTAQLGRFLAGLHAIRPTDVPGLTETEVLGVYRDRYREIDDVSPTFEATFRWLEANRPASSGPVVVHGDFRLGNVIVGPDGLRAAIDWELVHLGDPLEDLGWLCVKAWRFGGPLPVAGIGTLDQLTAAYQTAGGCRVDGDAFQWWLVMNTLKWGIMCMDQASVHLARAVRSVELAAIGRRVCEQEWDLLELLAPDAWAQADPAGPERSEDVPGLHGRPTLGELVEAVHEYLSTDVLTATDGLLQFHSRVAANVLGIVGRQLAIGESQEARYQSGLDGLGVSSGHELAAAIGRGEYDLRQAELYSFLGATVRDRLAVANPKYLSR